MLSTVPSFTIIHQKIFYILIDLLLMQNINVTFILEKFM